MVRKGYKKAIVALAHKMLRIIYAMLSNGTHYKDSTVDYGAMLISGVRADGRSGVPC